MSDGLPKLVDGADGHGAQMGLQLGEGHFDRVEIRAVGRQEQKPCAPVADSLFGDRTFVGGQVVHDDNVAFFQRRGELGFDIGFEDAPIHGRIDDERGGEGVATQPGDEGLRFPMPERGFGAQALALGASTAQARHFRGRPSLVEENQPMRFQAHLGLPFSLPFLARLPNVGTIAFAGQQRFF